MEWRTYDPAVDRDEAHETLRALLRRGVPGTIHPGDWDWWTFHRDPRLRTEWFSAAGALAEVSPEQRSVTAFGAPMRETIALAEQYFDGIDFTIEAVSALDAQSAAELEARGFTRNPTSDPIFERPTAGGVAGARPPEGFVLRALRGEPEHVGRAAAARRAFASDMDPAMHAARYLRFMRSPAYVAEHDIVAVAPDGQITSFAIHWPDAQLSLAQFEPVGTDPDFQRLGLSRAVIAYSLERLGGQGIERARVFTHGNNAASIACYSACGFAIVDRVHSWTRAGTLSRS